MLSVLGPVLVSEVTALAQVFSWECDSLPVDAGWNFLGAQCDPETWVADGWYHQELDSALCQPPITGAQEAYRRELTEYVGQPLFFIEWLVEGGGPSSDLIYAAPTALGMGASGGINYAFNVATDMARFVRDVSVPTVYVGFAGGGLTSTGSNFLGPRRTSGTSTTLWLTRASRRGIF